MGTSVERIVLYLVVLALAIAVGYLAFKIDRIGCDDTAILAAIDDLEKSVTDAVNNAASHIDLTISTHDAKTAAALDGINEAVGTIKDGLVGLEGRTADAVVDKLIAAGCLSKKDGKCQPPGLCPTPCVYPPPTTPKLTLLYEDVHLTKNSDVTEYSFGVKLEPRHRERLELLAGTLRPCHSSDDPVEFRVTGSASTEEFQSISPMLVPELRQKTANLRGKIVGDYLTNQGFKVQTHQDLDDAQPSVDQHALNQAVFLELLSAGACDSP